VKNNNKSKNKNKSIILTGGGTAGHVTPNIALLKRLKEEGYKIYYIGSKDGIEKELINKLKIDYYGISSGKLRRYFDKKNFSDMFRVVKGVKEASSIIKKLKPSIVFSKGGFVSVPVVMGARIHRIPVIIHESDITPGLANKMALPFATKICTTFPETLEKISSKKGILTGSPIRNSLFSGTIKAGLELCGFNNEKPVLLIMGGSLGSVKINTALREALNTLLKSFQIVHICGKGNFDNNLTSMKGYKQFEYLSEELPNIFAASDIIASRAGSNSICEFLALKKPNLLIPLSKEHSRGDQILNAASFEKQGFSKVLLEEDLTAETLIEAVNTLYASRGSYTENMKQAKVSNGVDEIIKLILKYSK